MELLKKQKYFIISILFILNSLLTTLQFIYLDKWYVFMCILAVSSSVNCINTLLLIGHKITQRIFNRIEIDKTSITRINRVKYDNNNLKNKRKCVYVLPCYNESEEELMKTVKSIINQTPWGNQPRLLFIICDGKIKGRNNILGTDKILTEIIFKEHIIYSTVFPEAYRTWNNNWRNLEIHRGVYHDMPFIIIVKQHNEGKRDSLTLIRRVLQYYNTIKINEINELTNLENISKENFNFIEYYNYLCPDFLNYIEAFLTTKQGKETDCDTLETNNIYNKELVNFIIGTDADTILSSNCTNELLKSYYDFEYARMCSKSHSRKKDKLVGIVGMVDIIKNWYNPLVIYQYCEYIYAQCLKRKMQSEITNKVNCLSGCVQLIKVCKETCGNEILDVFNRAPHPDENIINHIRSYASEDRNHICLMFSLYPYVKTIQAINAIAYTEVPNDLKTLLRQRKRWCVGAIANDFLLIWNGRHNWWERINAFANVITFSFNIFIFIATVAFIMTIIREPTFLMLQLAIIIIIPLCYSLSTPLIIYNDGINTIARMKNIIYYYIGVLNYYSWGFILSLLIYCYTFYYLDDLNWNLKKITSNNHPNPSITSNYCDNDNSSEINSLSIIKTDFYSKNKTQINVDNDICNEMSWDLELELDGNNSSGRLVEKEFRDEPISLSKQLQNPNPNTNPNLTGTNTILNKISIRIKNIWNYLVGNWYNRNTARDCDFNNTNSENIEKVKNIDIGNMEGYEEDNYLGNLENNIGTVDIVSNVGRIETDIDNSADLDEILEYVKNWNSI